MYRSVNNSDQNGPAATAPPAGGYQPSPAGSGGRSRPGTGPVGRGHDPLTRPIPKLKPKGDYSECACGTKYGFWRKKTNCHYCGDVKCPSCVNDQKLLLPQFGEFNPVHVCTYCVFFVTTGQMSEVELYKLPTKDLQKYIKAYNLKGDGLLEKSELVKLIANTVIGAAEEKAFRAQVNYAPVDKKKEGRNEDAGEYPGARAGSSRGSSAAGRRNRNEEATPERGERERRERRETEARARARTDADIVEERARRARREAEAVHERARSEARRARPRPPSSSPPHYPYTGAAAPPPPPPGMPPGYAGMPGSEYLPAGVAELLAQMTGQFTSHPGPTPNGESYTYTTTNTNTSHNGMPYSSANTAQSGMPSWMGGVPPMPNHPGQPQQQRASPSTHAPRPQQPQQQQNRPSQPRPAAIPPPPSLKSLLATKTDPSTLSVKTLKQILAENLVDHANVLEKSELVTRVKRLLDAAKVEAEIQAAADESYKNAGGGSTATGAGQSGGNDLESMLCKICCDKVVNCVFLECGHLVTCMDCGKLLEQTSRECPICRERISRIVRTFNA